MPGPVVVGVDGSPTSLQAVREAAAVSTLRSVPLLVVYVRDLPSAWAGLAPGVLDQVRQALDEVQEETRRAVTAVLHDSPAQWTFESLSGEPAQVLGEVVDEQKASLVVVGSRGVRSRMASLGSVAIRLVHHSTASVLVVRGELDLDLPPAA